MDLSPDISTSQAAVVEDAAGLLYLSVALIAGDTGPLGQTSSTQSRW